MILPSYLTCAKSLTRFSSLFASLGVPLERRAIIDKFAGGPVGLDTLAAAIGEDAGTIEDVYEPYLVKNGFINRTPKGRVATDLAFALK